MSVLSLMSVAGTVTRPREGAQASFAGLSYKSRNSGPKPVSCLRRREPEVGQLKEDP